MSISSMADSARILVADDHPITVHGIRGTLARLPAEVDVTFQPRGVISWLSQTTFDLLVLDIWFPDFPVTGFDVLRALGRSHPQLPVLMTSVYPDTMLQEAARREGARGFVSKLEPESVWMEAARNVLAGGIYFRESGSASAQTARLSERQVEVTRLLCQGLSEQECARELGISPSMVEKHTHEAKYRIGAHSVGQLIRDFVQRGLHLLPGREGEPADSTGTPRP